LFFPKRGKGKKVGRVHWEKTRREKKEKMGFCLYPVSILFSFWKKEKKGGGDKPAEKRKLGEIEISLNNNIKRIHISPHFTL